MPLHSVHADGMMVYYDPYSNRWDYSNETEQQAFIDFNYGVEKMVISTGFSDVNSNGSVWLFPVPANPEKITVNIVNDLPAFNGEEISQKVQMNLDKTEQFLQSTQIYMIPYVIVSGFGRQSATGAQSMGFGMKTMGSMGGGSENEPDVVVHNQLEKEGITSEVITAKTATGLYDYLKNKGLNINSGSIPVLSNYIGKDYSFIASWISSPAKYISLIQQMEENLNYYLSNPCYPRFLTFVNSLKQKYPEFSQASEPLSYLKSPPGAAVLQNVTLSIQKDPSIVTNICNSSQIAVGQQRGIFVAFPTDRIFFPLLPTSVYGNSYVPATIRIVGYVSPEIFPEIKNYTTTEYFTGDVSMLTGDSQAVYPPPRKSAYTKITINAPSKNLSDDLWVENNAPIKTYFTTVIATQPLITGIILLIVSSALAGIFAGFFLFRDLKNPFGKLALIGLSNCLSVFGVIITTMLVRTKNKNENIDTLLMQIRQKGYFRRRKIALILFSLAIPLLIIEAILMILFIVMSIWNMASGLSYYGFLQTIISDLLFFLFPNIFLFLILVAGFIKKRIKPEDKNLFEQLKSFGYSTWSFQPKDTRKLLFIPLFSVVFLAVSWALVTLIGKVI